MFLTADDIAQLTGYKRPSAQVRWLKNKSWKFDVNARGLPVVAVAEFHRHLVGGRAARSEPNFEAMNG